MAKKIIFHITGGIGKNISATAVIEAIAKQEPNKEIIVVCGYPEVFINNPHVSKCYNYTQTQYFYKEHIEGKDYQVLAHDPYLDTGFIKQDRHLNKVWAEMYGFTYNGEQPKLYLNKREMDFYTQKIQSDKPIMVMQTNGGAENQAVKYSWARDIPSKVVMAVVEEFSSQYNILHIRRQDQIGYEKTTPITDQFRSLAAIITLTEKRLFMDSFAQHTAAALNLPSTVLWIANKPQVFGYDLHTNIVSNPETAEGDLKSSYLAKYDIIGDPMQFPYNDESEIFDIDKVIASLK
jgi:hypothetical protein